MRLPIFGGSIGGNAVVPSTFPVLNMAAGLVPAGPRLFAAIGHGSEMHTVYQGPMRPLSAAALPVNAPYQPAHVRSGTGYTPGGVVRSLPAWGRVN